MNDLLYTPLNIIFTHSDFYIFEKPAGLNFHSEDGPGLVVLAEQQTGEKLFAVHRLDKVTSGLIILARNKTSAAKFTALFTNHAVDKYYLAVSDAKPKKKARLDKRRYG